MHFLWPEMLWLLLLAPAAIGGYLWLLRRKSLAVRYASLATVRSALGPGVQVRRHIPPALFLLALVAALVAAARPTAVVTLPSEQRVLMMAMDVSLSMRARDVAPNRMVAAQTAAKTFVQGLPPDVRAGIVTFAGTASVVQKPTHNRDDLVAAIDRFEMQRHTAIGSGIIVALATIFPNDGIDLEPTLFSKVSGRDGQRTSPLERPPPTEKKPLKAVPPGSYNSAAIVLLTDGRRTIGPDPLDAARMAAERGIRVFTVGFGSPEGGSVTIDDMSIYMRFDEEALKAIANITRAEYFRAGNADDLTRIYADLNSRFALERKETEVAALFAAVAAALAVLAAGLSMLWSNRLA